MFVPGLGCGPLFRVSCVNTRPPKRQFAAPAFRNHCFFSAKWVFAVTSPTCFGRLAPPRFCTTFLRISFCGSHQVGFARQKNGLGLQNWGRFEMTFFTFFPGEDQFVKFLARGCVAFWVRVGLVAENGLSAAVRRVFFRVFRGSSFDTVFANLKGDLLKLPSSSFHVRFGAIGPKPFFSFCFLSFHKKKKTLFFSSWTRKIVCSFLCVSLSLSLASFTSPFDSLSLSIFLVSCFFLPCFLCFFLWPSLFAVISCLVSLLLFHENSNIKILHVKGFFSSIISVSFGFLICFVFQISFSYLCFHDLSSVFWWTWMFSSF